MNPLGPVTIATGIVVLALASSALLHGSRSLILSAVMCGMVLAGVLATPPARAWLRKAGRSSRIILAGFIGLMLAGQFADQPRRTFPFSVFHMFGSVHTDAGRGSVSIFDLHGVGRDGHRVTINADRLFPTLGLGTMRMGHRLRELIDSASPATEGGRRLDSMLDAIAEGHRRLGFDPLLRIEVVRRSVPTRADRIAAAPEIVWTHDLGGRQ